MSHLAGERRREGTVAALDEEPTAWEATISAHAPDPAVPVDLEELPVVVGLSSHPVKVHRDSIEVYVREPWRLDRTELVLEPLE
jgi:hypothetical protein